MRYLFNLPVTPFAIGFFAGGIPPSNLTNWIFYVILEPLLISIELAEDHGLIKLLKDLLFAGDNNNSLGAAEFNYLTACDISRKEALKANPIVEIDVGGIKYNYQKTKGGQYLLPDGNDYKGYYHKYKDGTIKTGKTTMVKERNEEGKEKEVLKPEGNTRLLTEIPSERDDLN